MAQSISFGKMQIHLTAGKPTPQSAKPAPDTPFRMLILGDFSGRANRGVHEPLTSRQDDRPIAVDCDNLDQVMVKLGVGLQLALSPQGGPGVAIRFNELDDFHPDAIYDRLDLFQALKQVRQGLLDPSTFESAAAQVRRWGQPADASVPPQAEPPQPVAAVGGDETQDEMFQRLLGRPGTSSDASGSAGQVETLIQQAVAPHIVQSPDPRQAELVGAVDAAMTRQMRAVLHHEDFRSLEAAWRGVDFLVRHLETGQHLQLFLFDITQEELAADVTSTDDLSSTGFYRLMVEQAAGSPGGEPWALVAADFTFDATVGDAQTLGRVAKIAAAGGGPFLGGAHPRLVGCESIAKTPDPGRWTSPMEPQAAQAWRALRRIDEASYLGLALPRFLMRLPYGQETDAIDRFEMQEIEGNPSDEQYLWGNPVFICAYLLGQSFSQHGWGLTPGGDEDVEDLPAHSYKQGGESKMTPCARAWLTDRAAEVILGKGLMPLLSIQGRDAVKLVRFQSLADPASNLAGRWGQG